MKLIIVRHGETKENIEMYWRLSSDVAKMRKGGIPLSVPN
jgi:broad specificity phosphatase PhoE